MPLTYLEGADGDKIKVHDIDGAYTHPWGHRPNHDEEFRSIRHWKARDDDIMICAYPKSGTHWAYEFICMLMAQNAGRVKVPKQQGMLDYITQTQFDQMVSPRVLNTHNFYSALPEDFLNRKCKIIHIVRNPKDVAVSFFHHHAGIQAYEYDGTWEQYLPRFLEGKVDYNSWFDYTIEWEKAMKENPNYPLHLMYYEDLKLDFDAELFKLASFLGVPCSSELAMEIKQSCALDKMRRDKPFPGNVNKGFPGIYRKGITGDWKNMFTVAQNELFDQFYKERMGDSNLNIRYSI